MTLLHFFRVNFGKIEQCLWVVSILVAHWINVESMQLLLSQANLHRLSKAFSCSI